MVNEYLEHHRNSSDKSDEWQHGHEDFLSALLKENTEEAERITCEQLESGKSLILNAAMTSSDLEEVNIVPKLPTKGPSHDVLNPNYCSTES